VVGTTIGLRHGLAGKCQLVGGSLTRWNTTRSCWRGRG
jgi:hypothetical protein